METGDSIVCVLEQIFVLYKKDNYLNFTFLISIFFKLSKSSQIILVYFNFSFQDM